MVQTYYISFTRTFGAMDERSEVVLLHEVVEEEDLHTLKERLARHLPHSIYAYGPVCLADRYGINRMEPCTIQVSDDEHLCFITIFPRTEEATEYHQFIFMFCPEDRIARNVTTYLSHIPGVDWTRPVILIGLPDVLTQSLQALDSIGGQRIKVQTILIGDIFILQDKATTGTELLPQYHLSQLREEDAPLVWTKCYYNNVETEDDIKQDILSFPSIGIREEETLVSWYHMYRFGWMGNCFTMPEHRRKGLGSMVCLALCQKLLQEGLLPYIGIRTSNTISMKFHEDLGFKPQFPFYNYKITPA